MSKQNTCITYVLLTIALVATLTIWGCDHNGDEHTDSNTLTIPSFQKPADGRLTEQQVADYIVIRQKIISDVRAQKSTQNKAMVESKEVVSSGFGNRHFDEIERAAANAHNMSYDEFLWIKDNVITLQTHLLVQRYYELNSRIMTLLDQTLTRYKETNTQKLGQQEQQVVNGYVAEMKQEMADLRGKITDSNEKLPALEHNIILINQFKNELEELQQEALQ
jgi:hypothetical protein